MFTIIPLIPQQKYMVLANHALFLVNHVPLVLLNVILVLLHILWFNNYLHAYWNVQYLIFNIRTQQIQHVKNVLVIA